MRYFFKIIFLITLSIRVFAVDSLMFDYYGLVETFAFDDEFVFTKPYVNIEKLNLNITNIISLLYQIDTEIKNGKFYEQFDPNVFDEERIVAVMYAWFAELVHTKEISTAIQKKYDSYDITNRIKRDYIYSMMVTLEEDELKDFIIKIMNSSQYHLAYKLSLLTHYISINPDYIKKRQLIEMTLIDSLKKQIYQYDFIDCDKYFSHYLPNYTYSDRRKEVLNKAITYLANQPGREKDRLELEKRLKSIYRKKRAEWWSKHRGGIFLGSGFLIFTIFAFILTMRLFVHRHPS